MPLLPPTIESLLMDESFINDCLGKDPVATAYWNAFGQANPGYRELLEEARRCVGAMYAWGQSTEVEEQWDKLQELIGEKDMQAPREAAAAAGAAEPAVVNISTRRRWFPGPAVTMSAAAVVTGILLFTGLHIFKKQQPPSVSYVMLSAPDGTVKKCDLPDGSIVWLDAGSAIRYKNDHAGSRQIELLDGEIFCKVKHDENHPFVVHTPGGIALKDVGTAFDVQSYKGLSREVFRVMEGAVALIRADSSLGLLKQGQGVGINRLDGTLDKVDNPVGGDASWIRGRIELNDISFRELAIVLEKTYGIQIVFERRELMDCKASTSFNRADPVKDVLDALKLIYGITYTMNGYTLVLHGSGRH